MNATQIAINNLPTIAVGLNIEGCRPTIHMPTDCKWFNIIQVIDCPLEGDTFDDVMKRVTENKLDYIEQAVGIDTNELITQIVTFINRIKKDHANILVHVHQYTGTTKLAAEIERLTNIKTILDTTNFYDDPIKYNELYPDIDALISVSQCAGFGLKQGQWIIATDFMDYDVNANTIHTSKHIVDNAAAKYFPYEYASGTILVVNDLWNPTKNDPPIMLSSNI